MKKNESCIYSVYNETFHLILQNIIGAYPDDPYKVGQIYAQLLLTDELDDMINNPHRRKPIKWELDYLIRIMISDITCFRFLCSWMYGTFKSDEELSELCKTFNRMAETTVVREWRAQLIKGYTDFIKETQKKYPDLKSNYFDTNKKEMNHE